MRILPALFFAAALCGGAHAAPASDASIVQLLAVMQTEKMMDGAFAVMDQSMRQTMTMATRDQNLTDAQRQVLDNNQVKIARIIRDEMSWDKMSPLYLQIYRESFTQEEVEGLIAFYQSPTGVAFVQKMPAVMQKTSVLMQDRMGPMMARVQAAVRESVEEAKAAR